MSPSSSSQRDQNQDLDYQNEESKESLRILVVEDIATNRKLLVRLLKNRGHHCDEAVDGQEAGDAVQESLHNLKPYDTILTDYEMPR